MARKASVTETTILETALLIAQKEGYENVTARKLASAAGCSTQPIFRLYESMEELTGKVYEKAIQFFAEYYERFPKKNETPFGDLGMAYICFAEEEKQIFRLLFLSDVRGEKSMYELLNGQSSAVSKEIAKARAEGCSDPGGLFMKMWIFIHGAACMTITGDFDLSRTETEQLLLDSYKAYSKVTG